MNFKNINPHLLLFICFTIAYACAGPKSLTKKGHKLSEAGMHQQAINYYIDALDKKNTYVDAQIGLKNSSNIVLNDYLNTFSKAYMGRDNKTAVYTFIEMKKFMERVNRYNVKLDVLPSYKNEFENAKEEYLKSRFEEANHLISKDKFSDAYCVFEEIESIDPDFNEKDFDKLKEMALLEPHYRKGIQEMNKQQYRSAYQEFKWVSEKNPQYKDNRFKMEDALNNAQYPITINRFENYSEDFEIGEVMRSNIINELINKSDPFVKIIDDSKKDMAKLIAKAKVKGKVLNCDVTEVPIRSRWVPAYESYSVKKYDPVNQRNYYETHYRKVRYREFYGHNEVYISFQIQLISNENGQVLLSETINKQSRSDVNYATYNGNYNNLVPGNWTSEYDNFPSDYVNTNTSAINELKRKFSAPRNLSSATVLKNSLQNEIGKIASERIVSFNPEDKIQ